MALVSQDGLPDGISASPVLSSTYADGALVPILVVGDTLPAAVSDYLAATPQADTGGAKINLSIVAIGGVGAVSASVMDAALAAAASADDLSVQIGNGGATIGGGDDLTEVIMPVDVNEDGKTDGGDVPLAGHDKVRLFFSDNVIATADELTAMVRDILEVNGVPARLAPVGDTPVVHGAGEAGEPDDVCDPDTVTVTLANALKAGDTISVVSGAKLGVPPDQRAVGAASVTVPAPAADRTRPTVSVIMIARRTTAEVTISEPVDEGLDQTDVTPRKAAAAADLVVNSIIGGVITFDRALVAGDRITVASGAAEDDAGNKSLQRSFSAIAAHKSPRITSVLMSSLKHSTQMSTQVPGAFTTPDGGDNAPITIAAKSDGAAAGAAGNAWGFVFDVASSYNADKDLDIDVRVNSRDKAVFVRFNNGKAKFADLKAELEGNSAFDAMFEVGLPLDTTTGVCGATANNNLTIATTSRQLTATTTATAADGVTVGMTQVAIEVRFNGYVETVIDDELLDDILRETARRNKLEDGDGNTDDTGVRTELSLTDVAEDAFSAPGTTVRYEAITSMAGMLPQVRDLVNTQAGIATAVPDATPAVVVAAHVATGYADDVDPAPGVDRGGRGQERRLSDPDRP